MIKVYIDGSCIDNPGPGGWGVVIEYNGRPVNLSGFDPYTTSNRMELQAVIEVLKYLNESTHIQLHSDNKYVVNALTLGWLDNWRNNGWKTAGGSKVKNRDLWQELYAITQKHTIVWTWVKAQEDTEGDVLADMLAQRAAREGMVYENDPFE